MINTITATTASTPTHTPALNIPSTTEQLLKKAINARKMVANIKLSLFKIHYFILINGAA